jgi:hypothetical protein
MAVYLGRVIVFQVEKFHTHLAILYLEDILKKRKEGNEEAVTEAREKLRHLLQVSNLYRVQLLLGKMSDADLHQEVAVLYGKVNIMLLQINISQFPVFHKKFSSFPKRSDQLWAPGSFLFNYTEVLS